MLFVFDWLSRLVLAPPRLLAQRRQEYQHATEQSSEYNALMMRQHVGGGRGAYDPKADASVWEVLTKRDSKEMEQVIGEIMDAKNPTPVIVAIEKDLRDEHDPDTYHLFLAFPPPDPGGGVATPGPPKPYPRRIRAPLVEFSELLAEAFEGKMTSTALCFVADASSGMGSETLATIARRCSHGVATIPNPAWMTSLSLLVSKTTHNITTKQFERVVFSLCRLDAWRVRESVGTSRTVLFTLPGQACVPLLLPLIQRMFVHERHVFVYDGCCHTVEMGAALLKQHGSSYQQQAVNEVWEEVSASPTVISSTIPMAPLRRDRDLPEALAKLDWTQASVVEAWMASVDAFSEMKAKEKKNFYTPFVCRMGFLMKRSGIGNGDGSDLSGLALKNVLQYITGSKSRALPNKVMAAAVSCMDEMRARYEDVVEGSKLNNDKKTLIEQCVFIHKSILLGEKTLLDTVQPKEDWSLKAARKLKTCLCCIPDEENEDSVDSGEEDEESSKPKDKIDLSVPGAFATITAGRPKYVDGKTQFAFDPTMFSK